MDHTIHLTAQQEPPRVEGLVAEKSLWPDEAAKALTSVMRELDHWCREQGCSMVNNSWIAEEAIRQSW